MDNDSDEAVFYKCVTFVIVCVLLLIAILSVGYWLVETIQIKYYTENGYQQKYVEDRTSPIWSKP